MILRRVFGRAQQKECKAIAPAQQDGHSAGVDRIQHENATKKTFQVKRLKE
jgi:hypothetical protein